jgi:hypothetical protein
MRKLAITCSESTPVHRNTLRGFATIRIAEMRLEIRDVAIHEMGGSCWAQLPSKPQIPDGELMKDAMGKIQYTFLMDFDNRAVRDAFSRAAVDAVLQAFPDAFEPETIS